MKPLCFVHGAQCQERWGPVQLGYSAPSTVLNLSGRKKKSYANDMFDARNCVISSASSL